MSISWQLTVDISVTINERIFSAFLTLSVFFKSVVFYRVVAKNKFYYFQVVPNKIVTFMNHLVYSICGADLPDRLYRRFLELPVKIFKDFF